MSKPPAESGADNLASRLLQRLPGGRFAQEQLDRVERRLLQELKQRLDRLEQGRSSLSVLAVSVQPRGGNSAAADLIGESPARLLNQLLQMSADQDREQAERAFFAQAVANLLPDEARILSAFSDGSVYPVLDLMVGSRLGPATRPVLELLSSVGRNAGVQCKELTPIYLRRLRAWGLIEMLAEDPAQQIKYEMLETDTVLRQTIDRIQRGGQRARIVRGMLKMTTLGESLWAACRVEQMDRF